MAPNVAAVVVVPVVEVVAVLLPPKVSPVPNAEVPPNLKPPVVAAADDVAAGAVSENPVAGVDDTVDDATAGVPKLNPVDLTL